MITLVNLVLQSLCCPWIHPFAHSFDFCWSHCLNMCILISKNRWGWGFINDWIFQVPGWRLKSCNAPEVITASLPELLCAQQGLMFSCWKMNEQFPCPMQICHESLQHFCLAVDPFQESHFSTTSERLDQQPGAVSTTVPRLPPNLWVCPQQAKFAHFSFYLLLLNVYLYICSLYEQPQWRLYIITWLKY